MCKAMAPECTIPIRTGRPATTKSARNIPRAVAAIKQRHAMRVESHQRQAARGEDKNDRDNQMPTKAGAAGVEARSHQAH